MDRNLPRQIWTGGGSSSKSLGCDIEHSGRHDVQSSIQRVAWANVKGHRNDNVEAQKLRFCQRVIQRHRQEFKLRTIAPSR